MSTCISLHGEYGEHILPGTKFSEFDCDRCYVFDEDAAMAEVERLRSVIARVEALADAMDSEANMAPEATTSYDRGADHQLDTDRRRLRKALADPEASQGGESNAR